MKLSKECIEEIKELSKTEWAAIKFEGLIGFIDGAKAALTNQSIYEKAGLISLEDAFGYGRFVDEHAVKLDNGMWFLRDEDIDGQYDDTQLFQIYQEQKEKK